MQPYNLDVISISTFIQIMKYYRIVTQSLIIIDKHFYHRTVTIWCYNLKKDIYKVMALTYKQLLALHYYTTLLKVGYCKKKLKISKMF